MSGKLLKYDMREIGRILLPMYIALLAIATAAALVMRFSIMRGAEEMVTTNVPGVAAAVLVMVFGLMGLATAIVTFVMILRNFRENLLGNRGYLMNTLPVSTFQQVLSKTASAVFYIIFGGGAAGLSGLIFLSVNFRKVDWEELREAFAGQFGQKTSPVVVLLQILVLILFLSVRIVAKIFASLSIGNLWKSHRNAGAVLVYVGFTILQDFIYSLLQRITADASFGYALMQSGIRFIFAPYIGPVTLMTARQLAFSLGGNLIYSVLFFSITVWMLKNRLDLE